MSDWTDELKEGAIQAAKRTLQWARYERVMGAVPWASQAGGAALLRAHGELKARGWFRSFSSRLPVDRDGQPLPWFTYGSIAFLEPRVQAGWRVFEFGSGHSTLWWAKRVARVVAVEHHAGWAEHVGAKLPHNAELRFRALEEDDAYTAAPLEDGELFDVIVIDGRQRVQCAHRCLDALAPGGVVIWDNSERERYEPGLAFLASRGFRRVDFDGMGPINTYGWRTTLLYRDHNVLGL